MAEEIVACPGCAKKFRIPEGAESPGSFPCTACGVDVPYGAAPAPAARRAAPAAKTPQRSAAPASRPAPAAAPARAAPSSSRAASSSRAGSRAVAEQPRAGRGRRAPQDESDEPKSANQGLIWGGISVGGIALIAIVYFATKPSTAAPVETSGSKVATKPVETAKPTPPVAVETPKPEPKSEPAPTPVKAADPAAAGGDAKPPVNPAPTKPDAPADVKKPDAPAATKPVGHGDYAVLGQTFASVPGVTPEDRDQMDKWVKLAMDRNSAKEGSDAESALVRKAKKAIPSILTAFGKQYSGAKWAGDEDQWSADKLQDLLHRITGNDCIQPDYYPRFNSGESSEAFEKAANMWINWWQKAQFKDKFSR